ncbi:MAG: hypothetical protein CMM01_15640 [Rhodopirellula sp.]|nr:hypothetical protein [Rhodopirellula sp.]
MTTDRLIAALAVPWLLCSILQSSGIAQIGSPQEIGGVMPQRFESSDMPISVTAEIVAAKSQVAVPMQYLMVIDAPRGTAVVLPPIPGVSIDETDTLSIVDQPFGDFLLTGVEVTRDVPTGASSGTRRTRLLLEIESLKPGMRRAPVLEVAYRLRGQDGVTAGIAPEGTVRIPALGIEIESVLVADDVPDKFRDIKSAVATPVDASKPASSLWPLVFVGAGVLFLGFFWWARRGCSVEPDQWAVQRIGELEQAYEGKQIGVAEVHAELSVVLRAYIQSACNTPATALCTSEFLDLLRRDGFQAEVISGARVILATADVNKFSPDLEKLGEHGDSPFVQARSVVDECVRLQRLTQQRRRKTGTPVGHATIETARKVEA